MWSIALSSCHHNFCHCGPYTWTLIQRKSFLSEIAFLSYFARAKTTNTLPGFPLSDTLSKNILAFLQDSVKPSIMYEFWVHMTTHSSQVSQLISRTPRETWLIHYNKSYHPVLYSTSNFKFLTIRSRFHCTLSPTSHIVQVLQVIGFTSFLLDCLSLRLQPRSDCLPGRHKTY